MPVTLSMYSHEGQSFSALAPTFVVSDLPRRKLTQHLPYALVIESLSKHFHRLEQPDDDLKTPVALAGKNLTGDPVKLEEAGGVSIAL
jgi:hypothetical protein